MKMPEKSIFIPWLDATRTEYGLLPVFLPYAGCPQKCIFCAQDKQSGVKEDSTANHLARLDALLAARREAGAVPVELAFYGGTFTALPGDAFEASLDLLKKYIKLGVLTSARCSTRPDFIRTALLDRMKRAGFTMVELGVQSFDDAALSAAGRGYGRIDVAVACGLVREAGLDLGIQLMPGMPGVSREVFLADVDEALRRGPKALRFYPCLVLEGSRLAELYRSGAFTPWELDGCLEALALGWLAAQRKNVAVIRMGLAPEPGLEEYILAGPRHASLGARVMARALLLAVAEALPRGTSIVRMHVPARCQGFFWGHGGEMRAPWSALGLNHHNLLWCAEDGVTVEYY